MDLLDESQRELDHRSASVFAVSFALRVFSDVRFLFFFLVLWSAATVTDAVCST